VGLISFTFNMTLCLWIIRKTNVRISMLVLTVLCAAASLASVLIPGIGGYIGCGVLVYAFYAVSLPVLQHMTAVEAKPEQKNLVMGFYNATKSLGSIVGSTMSGFLYGVHVKLPFLVVAAAYGLSILTAAASLIRDRAGCKE
jgi:DHA1 family multidrug resistance protein-like MFS transporter